MPNTETWNNINFKYYSPRARQPTMGLVGLKKKGLTDLSSLRRLFGIIHPLPFPSPRSCPHSQTYGANFLISTFIFVCSFCDLILLSFLIRKLVTTEFIQTVLRTLPISRQHRAQSYHNQPLATWYNIFTGTGEQNVDLIEWVLFYPTQVVLSCPQISLWLKRCRVAEVEGLEEISFQICSEEKNYRSWFCFAIETVGAL